MSTLLLCHADGDDGSTTFVDETGNCTFSAVYGAKQSTARSKFGTASAAFDGNYSTLRVSNIPSIGTGDFTIEHWVYLTSGGGNFFDFRGSAGPVVYSEAGADFNIYSPGGVYTGANNVLTANAWNHIALVRSGSTMTGYANGVAAWSGTDTGSIGTSCTFGANSSSGGTINGNIDEIRISDTAIYTSNFTPPTSAFSLSGGGIIVPRRRPLMLIAG